MTGLGVPSACPADADLLPVEPWLSETDLAEALASPAQSRWNCQLECMVSGKFRSLSPAGMLLTADATQSHCTSGIQTANFISPCMVSEESSRQHHELPANSNCSPTPCAAAFAVHIWNAPSDISIICHIKGITVSVSTSIMFWL